MKIDPLGSLRPLGGPKRSERASPRGAEFARHLDRGAQTSGVDVAGSVADLSSLLALNEVGPDESNRRAQARGEDLLDRLERLKLALLEGSISRATLDDLAAAARQVGPQVADPHLKEAIDEIELRAAVEIAKYEVTR